MNPNDSIRSVIDRTLITALIAVGDWDGSEKNLAQKGAMKKANKNKITERINRAVKPVTNASSISSFISSFLCIIAAPQPKFLNRAITAKTNPAIATIPKSEGKSNLDKIIPVVA
jgi:hypothetical protein